MAHAFLALPEPNSKAFGVDVTNTYPAERSGAHSEQKDSPMLFTGQTAKNSYYKKHRVKDIIISQELK